MNRIIKFLETDFLSLAIAKFREIPKVYIKSFVIIFIAINVAFAYHTFSFMWGDHDWGWLINGMNTTSHWYIGRVTGTLYPALFTGNNILPVLTDLHAYIGLTFNAIALCIYWKVPKSTLYYSIIGILLCIQLYTLSLLFYLQLITSLWLPFFIITALIFSEKATLCDKRCKRIAYLLSAIFLNLIAFANYPPVVNTIPVVFIGRMIIDVFLEKENRIFVAIKEILFRQRYGLLTIVLGALLFGAILLLLKNIGYINSNSYQLQTIGMKDFISHLMHVSYEAFRSLWHYPVSFFTPVLVRLFTSLFIFGVFTVGFNVFVSGERGAKLQKTKIIKIISLLILFLLIIIFSKTSALISTNPLSLYAPRILFYGNSFMLVFPLALIFLQRFNFPSYHCKHSLDKYLFNSECTNSESVEV